MQLFVGYSHPKHKYGYSDSSEQQIPYRSYIQQPASLLDSNFSVSSGLNGSKTTSVSTQYLIDSRDQNTCLYYPSESACNDNTEGMNNAQCGMYTLSKSTSGCGSDNGRAVCARACRDRCNRVTKGLANVGLSRSAATQQSVKNRCGVNDTNCTVGINTNKGDNTNLYQECIYDVAAYGTEDTTLDDINAFKVGMGCISGDMDKCGRNYDNLMVHWCGSKVGSESCPTDPITETKLSSCARMISSGSEGEACREWLSKKSSVSLENQLKYSDAVGSLYCNRTENINAPECKCINRGFDKTNYVKVKPNAPFNDGCWYNPCVPNFHPDFYFKPSDVQTGINANMCPQNICSVDINGLNFDEVNMSDNTAYLYCNTTNDS